MNIESIVRKYVRKHIKLELASVFSLEWEEQDQFYGYAKVGRIFNQMPILVSRDRHHVAKILGQATPTEVRAHYLASELLKDNSVKYGRGSWCQIVRIQNSYSIVIVLSSKLWQCEQNQGTY